MDRQATSRSRAPSATAGSPQRPARQLAGAVLSFDLAQEIASLQQEGSWQRGDRNARTLVGEPDLRIVMTVLRAGERIREHRTDRPVAIHRLEGYIRVESPDETTGQQVGRLMTLQPGVPHDLEAIEQSAFLLTIA
jgi:quercetin dioxygenase-like cupin family protein